ncbi:MAG: GNAT family N-acetyltransferase [Actinobacteria bacterium]|nr:MAG: GNAT family N-acetyltransferase [Actinomycetota bacterium]
MTGTLLVRADGGGPMGAGHVMRQLALAQTWAGRDGRVVLAAANLPGALATRWRDSGFEVSRLQGDPDRDAAALLDLAAVEAPDWISFDGYHLGPTRQREVAHAGYRLLVVDDHGALGRYFAEVIVDQNLGATATDYAERPAGSVLLLGLRYALLRREFSHDSPARSMTCREPLRLLVTLGGSPEVALLDVIRAGVGAARCAVELVEIGSGMPVADVAALMASCDLAVSAAGSTCWELCATGLPAALVVTAPNQAPVAARLAAHGVALNLGPSTELTAACVAETVEGLARDPEQRAVMAARGRALVDGRGASRVVAVMRSRLLALRAAVADDARLLWEWANDPTVRAAAFSQDPIPWTSHQAWMRERLRDPACRIYIAERHGRPLGQIRFQPKGPAPGRTEVGLSVVAGSRGEGWGSALIMAGVARVREEGFNEPLHALVKRDNVASALAFDTAGFERITDLDDPDGVLHLVAGPGQAGRDAS